MYTDKTKIDSYLGITLDVSLTTFITLTISAVTEFIEKYCGEERFGRRIFEKPDTDNDVTKYFDGNGAQKLQIGDLKVLTSLTIDDTLQVEEEDFYLKPYDAVLEGKPYDTIELIQPNGRGNSRLGTIYEFEKDQRNIKVIGKFRYSDLVPADIQLIATKLASQTLKERIGDQALREIKAETLDDYKIDYTDIAKTANDLGTTKVLDQYKRKVKTVGVGVVQL
jgi:hypothetical protein